jgi:DNA-binding MarR family transcriptional regulator
VEASMTNLSKLSRAPEELRTLDPELGTHTALVFITVAQAMPDGITQHELGIKLGMTTSTTQRNVKYLTKHRGVDEAGHDLIEVTTPRENGKMRLLRITPKGKRIAAKLAKMLD